MRVIVRQTMNTKPHNETYHTYYYGRVERRHHLKTWYPLPALSQTEGFVGGPFLPYDLVFE